MTGSSDGLCPFCRGLAVDSEKPIPETEFTCGNLSGFAKFMKDGTEDCSEMMLAEALCCSSPSSPCGFCSAGLTADADTPLPAGPDGVSYTCGQLTEFANIFDSDDDECGEMLLAEPLCCPSSNSEEYADEQADESDLGESDQEVEQSSPSDASEDEDAADTGEQSDAPDLWTVSPAIIYCAAFIAYVYL